VFETHFGLKWNNTQAPLKQINKAKWNLWKMYCQGKDFTADLLCDTKDVIKRRDMRKETAQTSKQAVVQCCRTLT
jgi:hypothetical protein